MTSFHTSCCNLLEPFSHARSRELTHPTDSYLACMYVEQFQFTPFWFGLPLEARLVAHQPQQLPRNIGETKNLRLQWQ